MMDPDPGPVLDPDPIEQIPVFFFLIFFSIRFKTHNDVFFCCNFELIISRILNKISDFKKKIIFL